MELSSFYAINLLCILHYVNISLLLEIIGMYMLIFYLICFYRIGGVMVSVLASSAVDHGFDPRLGQTKDYAICIFRFSARHAAYYWK
jgi:hypothetical protein